MAMKQALAQRMLRAVQLGHVPEFFSETTDKGKPGQSVRCSCGWVAPRARPLQKMTKAVFLWHLEEVLDQERRGASPEAS